MFQSRKPLGIVKAVKVRCWSAGRGRKRSAPSFCEKVVYTGQGRASWQGAGIIKHKQTHTKPNFPNMKMHYFGSIVGANGHNNTKRRARRDSYRLHWVNGLMGKSRFWEVLRETIQLHSSTLLLLSNETYCIIHPIGREKCFSRDGLIFWTQGKKKRLVPGPFNHPPLIKTRNQSITLTSTRGAAVALMGDEKHNITHSSSVSLCKSKKNSFFPCEYIYFFFPFSTSPGSLLNRNTSTATTAVWRKNSNPFRFLRFFFLFPTFPNINQTGRWREKFRTPKLFRFCSRWLNDFFFSLFERVRVEELHFYFYLDKKWEGTLERRRLLNQSMKKWIILKGKHIKTAFPIPRHDPGSQHGGGVSLCPTPNKYFSLKMRSELKMYIQNSHLIAR